MHCDKKKCVLIEDSYNDWEAAQFSGIHFFEYNCYARLSELNTVRFEF